MTKSKSQKVASKASKKSEDKDHNPFERRKNEPHFKIFGRRTQQAEQKVGQSRARAMEKRKKTLLIAMKQDSKANKFLDNRIGERNASMTQEERDLLRYQKEIQKRLKSNPFSLEDNEDIELLDSSLGKSFKNDYLPSDHEDEDDDLNAQETSELNFGGFGGEDENGQSHPKTRKEIMEEIIAKSKLRKHEKAKEKEQQEELMSQLDNDFLQIAGLLGTKNNKKEKQANDEYDILVKELAFDARSAPTNRLKTPEEILQEEKERLQKLDQERLKRMKGEDVEEVDPKRPKFQSADALEDDFIPDDKYKTFGPVQDEDEEEEEEDEEEDEEEQPDDSDDAHEVVIKRKLSKPTPGNESDDIPFTFDMPASYDDFLELLENRNLEQQKTIIHRIRVCNQVGQGNKDKMEQFFEILLQHFEQLSGEFPIDFGYLNYLTKFMYEAAKMSSQHATKAMQKKVKSMMKILQDQDKSNLSWPSTQDLLVLKFIGVLFTTSDFQHPVVTPAMLYMAYCLTNLPVRTGEEAAKGLFICNLFLSYLSEAKRYSPEAIRFLLGIFSSLDESTQDVRFSKTVLRLKSKKSNNNKSNKIRFSELNNSDLAYFTTDQFKIDALENAIGLLTKFMNLYSTEPAFEVVYSTILPTLKTARNNIPTAVKKSLEELISYLEKTSEASIRVRQPLLLQRKKVAQVRSLVPRFEENFAVGVDYDPNVKRAEKKRLEKSYKREKKGAIRELRKDNTFIQQEKFKQMREEDTVRKQKERKIMSELEQQEAQYKQAMRMKEAQKNKKKKSAF